MAFPSRARSLSLPNCVSPRPAARERRRTWQGKMALQRARSIVCCARWRARVSYFWLLTSCSKRMRSVLGSRALRYGSRCFRLMHTRFSCSGRFFPKPQTRWTWRAARFASYLAGARNLRWNGQRHLAGRAEVRSICGSPPRALFLQHRGTRRRIARDSAAFAGTPLKLSALLLRVQTGHDRRDADIPNQQFAT